MKTDGLLNSPASESPAYRSRQGWLSRRPPIVLDFLRVRLQRRWPVLSERGPRSVGVIFQQRENPDLGEKRWSPCLLRSRPEVAGNPAGVAAVFGLVLFVIAVASPSAHAKEGVIQCANLIYGENHTSRCFSDEFLTAMQKETTIGTERRFKTVKLESDELFQYPFVVITGEQDFRLTAKDRENLKKYLESGGFLLASAGCSNKSWDESFRREIRTIFGDKKMEPIPMNHPVFRTVYKVGKLDLSHGGEPGKLEGLTINDKLVMIYSPHGLNDTAHTEGCCCCGGNEISNSMEVNVNILVYALLY